MTYKRGMVPDCDAVLLAGDIGQGGQGWDWASKQFHASRQNEREVLYVAGNHEFYTDKWSINELNLHLLSKPKNNILFLQNTVREFVEQKVVVLGCTWWTDFLLNNNEHIDMLNAPEEMNDYNWISYSRGLELRPVHVKYENSESTRWLKEQIAHYRTLGWKIVVMTHHAPCQMSCPDHFKGRRENVYYANTIDRDYGFPLPDVFVHGHMHNSSDYMMGDCRVLSNPRGYVNANSHGHNRDFDPNFVFEI